MDESASVHNNGALASFSPQCVVCDAVPFYGGGRDVIPTCSSVEKTSSLWLRSYHLATLSSSDVGHLKHLENLYIEPGNLVRLEMGTFAGLHSLRRLSLTRNKLAFLGTGWLIQPNGRLNLAHNHIAYIQDGAFGSVDGDCRTMVLLLQWNRLHVIQPGYFRQLCMLTVLDLRYNRIHTIHKGSFNAPYRLRILLLAGNKLKVVTSDWFPRPPIEIPRPRLLSRVDLAQNQIQYIEPEAFMYAPLLEFLGLSNNQITSLHEYQFRFEYSLPAFPSITLILEGNPIRCTCALRWFLRSGRLFNAQSDFGLLACSYPKELEGTKLSNFTSDMEATMQCPTPKATVTALDDGRTFRCEVCWEEGPTELIEWTLPNDTKIITNVSFGTRIQVNLGDINATTSFSFNPSGFNCCHPKSVPDNDSTVVTEHCNFVSKTLSYVTISEFLVNGKDLSCTASFLSDGTNITAHHNVQGPVDKTTSFRIIHDILNATPSSLGMSTKKRSGTEETFVILNSEQRTANFYDLLITTCLTSSVFALGCFLVTALRAARERKRQEDNMNHDRDDPFSHHTYETVDGQPPLCHHYEVIRDDQLENDYVITPYAVAVAGTYHTDLRLPTRTETRQSPRPHRHNFGAAGNIQNAHPHKRNFGAVGNVKNDQDARSKKIEAVVGNEDALRAKKDHLWTGRDRFKITQSQVDVGFVGEATKGLDSSVRDSINEVKEPDEDDRVTWL
ncbi:PREDICTED: leucine-rich repeat and immunoglobulin-like domain-containing nogo receptor-interacting protein 4 [Branchiostoma belcheri]|uniref:Leucine-rich repeat and immunoglobulin-like domain-containing nogo receptor-interacting protein 4 n=1 Tax=Branchiostoma belcheri TaxID=7741 RepID=A0A6P5A3E6_BRABE|nr:PREDICTED: leucine-rich repeat and immunoglobulin-like domain-containing nogo receptor-interacting protein 4 [Branchiostoma belcheri]